MADNAASSGQGSARGKPDRAAQSAALAELSVEATSPDGAASVSVNTDGVLTKLRLGDAVERMSPAEIANAVLGAYTQAQRQSARQTTELLGPAAKSGYVAERLRWRKGYQPDLQPPSPPSSRSPRPGTGGGAAPARTTSTNPEDARNEYLKDRSVPGYDLVPPLARSEERAASAEDDWYDNGFRVKRRQ